MLAVQVSFMRQLLEAVRKLPIPWAMLEGQDLLKRVLQLQKFRSMPMLSSCCTVAFLCEGASKCSFMHPGICHQSIVESMSDLDKL